MLHMVKGCKIHNPAVLQEGYEWDGKYFSANVHAEKIEAVIEHFITLQNDRIFLILEIPTNAKDEVEIQPGVMKTLHMDVYYLDGLTKASAIFLLHTFGPLFIHDGMCRFGFGSHSGHNEIIRDLYNVVTIYTQTPGQYEGMFESHGIPRVSELRTAWAFFTQDTPGECYKVSYQGRDIYETTEHLKQYGLYFAERREKMSQINRKQFLSE